MNKLYLLAALIFNVHVSFAQSTHQPPNISYPTPNKLEMGVSMLNISPTNTGGPATKYTVSPVLPAGISLHTSTGKISGIPTVAIPPTSYQITGSNKYGEHSFSLIIQVWCVDIASVSAGYTTICPGTTTNLTANGVLGSGAVVTWWTGAGGTGTSLGTGQTLANAVPGNYFARVTGNCSIAAEASATINAFNTPVVTVTANGAATVCPASTVSLSAGITGGSGNVNLYQWQKNNVNIAGANTANYTATSTGNYTVVVTTTNGCTVKSNTITVRVEDITPPVVPALPTVNGQCSVTVTAPVATDNCKGSIIGTTTNPLSYSSQGSFVITWKFDDGNGNVSTAQQNVIVKDNTPPMTSPLPDVYGECSATATIPSADDNCAGLIAGTTSDQLSYHQQGTYYIRWSFDDGNGNVATSIQKVIVKDTSMPEMVIEELLPFGPPIGGCIADSIIAPPFTSDNCGMAGIVNDYPTMKFGVGTTTITWTATDIHGNFATATQDIVVGDAQRPTVIVPAGMYVHADPGMCFATIQDIGMPIAADNCGVASITNDFPSNQYPVGTTVVTWSVADIHGNVRTNQQKIIVVDKQRPVVANPVAVKVFADNGLCGASNIVLTPPEATDNCGVANITCDYMSTTFPVGITTITWTVTDIHGNVSVKLQKVTVYDYQKPIVTKPPSIWIKAEDNCVATVKLELPVTTDNCGIASITKDYASDVFPVGTTTVVWTITDVNGNFILSNQNVTVADKTAPLIVTPVSVTADLPTDACGMLAVNVGIPVVTDNCGVASIVSDNPSSTFPVGISYVTWTATDIHGNISIAKQKVTIYDRQKPFITAPSQVKLFADNGKCFASGIVLGTPTASDNCGIASITNNAPATFPVGTTTVIWTATDINGNKNSSPQKVIVTDNQKPVVTPPVEQTFCTGQSSYTVPTVFTNDNCGVDSISYTITGATIRSGIGNNASGIFNDGSSLITWRVKDVNGNVQTAGTGVNVSTCQAARSIVVESKIENTEKKKISAFPNPTSGTFTLRLQNYMELKTSITIINSTGVVVKKSLIEITSNNQSVTFNLSDLASGVYSVNVITKGEIKTLKLFLDK